MKKLVTTGSLIGTALVVGVAALPLLASSASYAATSTQQVNVTVAASITINNATTGTMSPVNITGDVSTASGAVAQANSPAPLTISTNNPNGYTARLTIDSTAENPGTTNPNAGTTNLVSGANNLTAGNLSSTNTWAAKGGAVSNWTAVPLSGNGFVIADTTAPSAAAGDQYTMTFGANTNSSTPVGTYTNTVLYTAVAKP